MSDLFCLSTHPSSLYLPSLVSTSDPTVPLPFRYSTHRPAVRRQGREAPLPPVPTPPPGSAGHRPSSLHPSRGQGTACRRTSYVVQNGLE